MKILYWLMLTVNPTSSTIIARSHYIYIDTEKKQDYQLAIKDDRLLSALTEVIIAGWPDNIKDVPKSIITILWPT